MQAASENTQTNLHNTREFVVCEERGRRIWESGSTGKPRAHILRTFHNSELSSHQGEKRTFLLGTNLPSSVFSSNLPSFAAFS